MQDTPLLCGKVRCLFLTLSIAVLFGSSKPGTAQTLVSPPQESEKLDKTDTTPDNPDVLLTLDDSKEHSGAKRDNWLWTLPLAGLFLAFSGGSDAAQSGDLANIQTNTTLDFPAGSDSSGRSPGLLPTASFSAGSGGNFSPVAPNVGATEVPEPSILPVGLLVTLGGSALWAVQRRRRRSEHRSAEEPLRTVWCEFGREMRAANLIRK